LAFCVFLSCVDFVEDCLLCFLQFVFVRELAFQHVVEERLRCRIVLEMEEASRANRSFVLCVYV